MADVSVLMRRGAEKVSSPDNEARQRVMILISLDFVLVSVKVAELFCADRFGDADVGRANCMRGWNG